MNPLDRRYPCGCINTRAGCGLWRNVRKCDFHRAAARPCEDLDAGYYAELGVITGDRLAATDHVAQLTEALGPFPEAPRPGAAALEIGCGVSPYCPAIRQAGYRYEGLDGSPWVSAWMRATYGVPVAVADFATLETGSRYELILAAHCIEHMADAPAAIRRCAELLSPGGRLWIIIPDDSDPTNPDHLWFFTKEGLRRCLAAAGLEMERIAARKYVPHEIFLYASARKPA